MKSYVSFLLFTMTTYAFSQVCNPSQLPLTELISATQYDSSKVVTQIEEIRLGTESGGGGGVIWCNSATPVLMDWFTITNKFDDSPSKNFDKPSRIENSSLTIKITDANQDIIKKTNSAFSLALNTLEKWQALPFDTMSLIVSNAFQLPLSWNFTERKLEAPPFYFAPYVPEGAMTSVVAKFAMNDISNSKVLINRFIWNQMHLRDQAGLLIHEALRQVQLGYGNGYNDEALQRATAIYIMCVPTGRLNYYLFFLLNNSPWRADDIYGPFKEFIQNECTRTP